MKLYYIKGTCSLSVRIILNELKLEFESIKVSRVDKLIETGENYLDINPKGPVPTLLTDDGELITENIVIHQYLADHFDQKHQLLPAVGSFQRYRVLEWMNFIATDLHKAFVPLFVKPFKRAIANIAPFVNLLKNKLQYADNYLLNRNYLIADNFSLADAYLFVVAGWMEVIDIDLSQQFAQIHRYHQSLAKRPAIIQSLQQES